MSNSTHKSKDLSASTPGSLNRATILLRVIAQGSHQGSLLKELVAKTDIPRPTIHRILNSLITIGWVIRNDKTSRFNLGLDLAALGYSAIARNPIELIASSVLAKLAVDLNQVVYMNIRVGMDMVCLGRYESSNDVQVGKGFVSMRGPFGMSPSCLGMIAQLPKSEVEDIVSSNMSRYHRLKGFDETSFQKCLTESLSCGFGVYNNILLDRTTSGLGVGICDLSGYPVAGIGTTFISGWLSENKYQYCIQQLSLAASEISERLFTRAI